MRLKDAVTSLQIGRKKQAEINELCTVWSEQAEDGPQAVPLSEYPRPQLRRAGWLCLNGWWDYGICPAAGGSGKGVPAEIPGKRTLANADGKILVPFSPETKRSGVQRILKPGEILWYRREIEVSEEEQENGRLILHFGAVDERCTVYWNGNKVGSHRNGYLAFCFDVTEYVKPGTNELVVFVRDDSDTGYECRGKQTLSPGGMYYHAQSGIWQTVWLERVPENYLKDLKITPVPEEQEVELELVFSGMWKDGEEVRILVGRPGTWGLEADISAGIRTYSFPFGDEMDGSVMKVRIPVPDPMLWSPEHPYLYSLYFEAGEDKVESYFAMRSFGVGKDEKGRPRLLLNGEPYFFNGVLDQGYWPESLMTAPADEALIYDITQMKEQGYNMLRKHVKIEPARWYYHCDRIGMVVWQDMINGGGPTPRWLDVYLPTILPAAGSHVRDDQYKLMAREDVPARRRFENDLLAMIRQLYNCPCISLWVPFNEGWGQFDALRITEMIRSADPTRQVDHASGWFDQGGGDVRSVHNYFRPLKVEKDARPFVISEYGGINCQIEGHSMSSEVYGYHNSPVEKFPQAFEQMKEKVESLVAEGLSAAVYTQVSDIEEETNGLLTYDRKVKKVSCIGQSVVE